MKKLIVLFAILAMANVASAGIVDIWISSLNSAPITPVKEITLLNSSDWINVDVVYTPDPGMSIFALSKEVVITGPMTASIGIPVSTPVAPGTITWMPTWNPDLSMITILPSGNPLIDAVANNFGTVAPGIVIDHFLFHCEGIGLVTIVLAENPATGAMESLETDALQEYYHVGEGTGIIIHQGTIPEPMTLVLLGLGSLFLARRKK